MSSRLIRTGLVLACIAALALPAVATARPAGGAFITAKAARGGGPAPVATRSDGGAWFGIAAGAALVIVLVVAASGVPVRATPRRIHVRPQRAH